MCREDPCEGVDIDALVLVGEETKPLTKSFAENTTRERATRPTAEGEGLVIMVV